MFFFCLFVLTLYNLSPSTSVVLEETLQRCFAVNLICLIHANIQVNKKQNFPEVFYFIYFYFLLPGIKQRFHEIYAHTQETFGT